MPIEPIVPLILVEGEAAASSMPTFMGGMNVHRVIHLAVLEVPDRTNVRIHGVAYEGQEAIARLTGT